MRTGLVAMASGVGARPLLEGVEADWLIIMTGSVLVLFSAFCFGAAVWRNFYRPRRRRRPAIPAFIQRC